MRVLNEHSLFRTTWNLVIFLLVIISLTIIPFQFAFEHQVTFWGSVIIYVIDLFFIANIYVNGNTSLRIAGYNLTEKSEIRKAYLNKGFKLDFFAAAPFDLLLLMWPGLELYGISLVLWLRLFRLIRLLQLFDILSKWKDHSWFNPAYLRILKFFSGVLFLSHVIACLWYLWAFFGGFKAKSWIVMQGIDQSDRVTQYIRSLYWTFSTMTTVGYGDITPHLNYEYVFTIVVMLMGASMYAFIIGNIASLLSSVDVQKATFYNRLDAVKMYLKHRGVPDAVGKKVRNFYEYRWVNHRGLEEDQILNDLPDPLRLDVMMELTRELLENVPLFRYSSENLKRVLLLALKAETFNPNATITRKGDQSKEIIFISKGEMEVVKEETSTILEVFRTGDYFGNLSIMLGEKRTASVRTTRFCETFILESEDFFRIKEDYPEFLEVMKKMSSEKTEKITRLLLEGVVL